MGSDSDEDYRFFVLGLIKCPIVTGYVDTSAALPFAGEGMITKCWVGGITDENYQTLFESLLDFVRELIVKLFEVSMELYLHLRERRNFIASSALSNGPDASSGVALADRMISSKNGVGR